MEGISFIEFWALFTGALAVGIIIIIAMAKNGKIDCGVEVDTERDLYIPTVRSRGQYVSYISHIGSNKPLKVIRSDGTFLQHQKLISEWKSASVGTKY